MNRRQKKYIEIDCYTISNGYERYAHDRFDRNYTTVIKGKHPSDENFAKIIEYILKKGRPFNLIPLRYDYTEKRYKQICMYDYLEYFVYKNKTNEIGEILNLLKDDRETVQELETQLKRWASLLDNYSAIENNIYIMECINLNNIEFINFLIKNNYEVFSQTTEPKNVYYPPDSEFGNRDLNNTSLEKNTVMIQYEYINK